MSGETTSALATVVRGEVGEQYRIGRHAEAVCTAPPCAGLAGDRCRRAHVTAAAASTTAYRSRIAAVPRCASGGVEDDVRVWL